MKSITKNIEALALATLTSALITVGCQSPDYPTPNVTVSGPSTATANALFVNASPNAPALNFLVENVQVAQSLAPGQASPYVAIPTGSIQVRAKAASGTIGGTLGSRDILYRAGATNQNNFTSAASSNYTIFVTDTIQRPVPTTPAGATNTGGPQFLVVTDNLKAPDANQSSVRFFNLSPDVSPVLLRLKPTAPSSTTVTSTFSSRRYRITSVTSGTVTTNFANYTTIPSGSYSAEVFTDTTAVSPIASTTVNLESTKIYTLYTQGLRKTKTLSVGTVKHN